MRKTLLNYAEAYERIRRSRIIRVSDRLTAREALNQVRAAANMPPIEDTGEAFTKRLRNERRMSWLSKTIVFGTFAVGWTGT